MMHRFLGGAGSLRRLYAFSSIMTLAAFVGVWLGLGPGALLTVMILSALEITFSFDNAVVNAKILRSMPVFWRQMFMTVGILIAVFGMRLILPIVLVAVTAGLGTTDVVQLALVHPALYAEKLALAHPIIAAFGGMFLLMIFIEFIVDEERDVHWLRVIEQPLLKAGQLKQLAVIIALIILLVATRLLGGEHQLEVLFAGTVGIVVNLLIRALATVFTRQQKEHASHQNAMRAGLFNFIYLEVLDASFSFDGVIGAFAITKMVILIAIGLGIGAVWVRSMTLHMVIRHTLSKYRYLDHGAHYAIGVLAVILLLGIQYEIPDFITGLTGVSIIGLALLTSAIHNRRDEGVVTSERV